jgi:calcineurin-like phosphoesterase
MNGIIGMDKKGAFRRMIDQLPAHLEVAGGPASVCGARIVINTDSGKAESIERVQFFE